MNWIVRREFFAGPLDGLIEETASNVPVADNPHKAISPDSSLKRRFAGDEYEYVLAGAFKVGEKVIFRYRFPGVYIPPNGWGDNAVT